MLSSIALKEIPELKKVKTTSIADKNETKALEKIVKQQNVDFFANRDFLENKLPKSNWLQLLEMNKQELPKNDKEVSIAKQIKNFHTRI